MVSHCALTCRRCGSMNNVSVSTDLCDNCFKKKFSNNPVMNMLVDKLGQPDQKKKEEKIVCKAVEQYGHLPLYVITGNAVCDFCTKKIVKGWHADDTLDFCDPCFKIWTSHEANKWIGIAVKYGAKFPYNFVEFCEFK